MTLQKYQVEPVRVWTDNAVENGAEIPDGIGPNGKPKNRIEKMVPTAPDDMAYRAMHELTERDGKLFGPNGEPFDEWCRNTLASTPHWWVAKITDSKADAWLKPTLAAQGKRYNEILRELDGDVAATKAAIDAEAALYDTRVGSLKAGTAPANVPDGRTKTDEAPSDNLWRKLRDKDGVLNQLVAVECGKIMKRNPALAKELAAKARVHLLSGLPIG